MSNATSTAPIVPTATEATRDFSLGRNYVKLYLLTRVIVGVIGIALPVVTISLDRLLFRQPAIRDSLSAYYHSPVRDWFVGSLCAIGVGLFTYMSTIRHDDTGPTRFTRILDRRVSTVAGVCALVVAFFPTDPEPGQAPTVFQELLGIHTVSVIHFWSAAALVTLLGLICFGFGRRDRLRPDRGETAAKVWSTIHYTCAVTIWVAVLAIAATMVLDLSVPKATLIGEIVAVWAFGVSWFLKGSELFTILLKESRNAKATAPSANPRHARNDAHEPRQP